MKYLLIFFLVSTAFADTTPPHIGPEGGRFNKLHIIKIERLIKSRIADKNNRDREEDLILQTLLTVGKKASEWINRVNETRAPDNQLDLSSSSPSGGISIHQPNKTNTEILFKRFNDFLKKSSPLLTNVLTSNVEYPRIPPTDEEEFINTMRALDRIYQSTIRWAGSRQWLSWYINRSIFDIRGYLFLSSNPDLKLVLDQYPAMPESEKNKYYNWLFGLCKNGDFDPRDCKKELDKYVTRNTLFNYYQRFNKYGKSMHDLFFTIKKTRPEVKWNPSKTLLSSPFQKPDQIEVLSWLKENVEDEWKGAEFNLSIDYETTTTDIPRIQFKSGVTANVNGIAGNLITMEAEYPLQSASQKWTIRHEYGHVLGFEDCYLEFYDTKEEAMIYYEVDVDNLMCSRNGNLKPSHIEQLKKAYQ